jgi:hypothetical protein
MNFDAGEVYDPAPVGVVSDGDHERSSLSIVPLDLYHSLTPSVKITRACACMGFQLPAAIDQDVVRGAYNWDKCQFGAASRAALVAR